MPNVNARSFYVQADSEVLAATLEFVPYDCSARVVSIHGAGPAGRDRISYLTNSLAAAGLPSLRFDFSGHGNSSGLLRDSSLSRRMVQARAFAPYLDLGNNLVLIGTSMGAHIASLLTAEWPVHLLVLFCPAAYSAAAFDLSFNNKFSSLIKEPNSWRTSDVFEKLAKFKGKAIIITGGQDQIIPAEVIELYRKALSCADLSSLHFESAPHNLHGWLAVNQKEREQVIAHVIERTLN